MQHVVHAGNRPLGDREVGQVSLDQLDARHVRQVFTLAGNEAVGNAHAFAAAEQLFGDMRPDEPGAAGDEVGGHVPAIGARVLP